MHLTYQLSDQWQQQQQQQPVSLTSRLNKVDFSQTAPRSTEKQEPDLFPIAEQGFLLREFRAKTHGHRSLHEAEIPNVTGLNQHALRSSSRDSQSHQLQYNSQVTQKTRKQSSLYDFSDKGIGISGSNSKVNFNSAKRLSVNSLKAATSRMQIRPFLHEPLSHRVTLNTIFDDQELAKTPHEQTTNSVVVVVQDRFDTKSLKPSLHLKKIQTENGTLKINQEPLQDMQSQQFQSQHSRNSAQFAAFPLQSYLKQQQQQEAIQQQQQLLLQLQSSPSGQASQTQISFVKKPDSRHQPSRMKFSTILHQNSSKNFDETTRPSSRSLKNSTSNIISTGSLQNKTSPIRKRTLNSQYSSVSNTSVLEQIASSVTPINLNKDQKGFLQRSLGMISAFLPVSMKNLHSEIESKQSLKQIKVIQSNEQKNNDINSNTNIDSPVASKQRRIHFSDQVDQKPLENDRQISPKNKNHPSTKQNEIISSIALSDNKVSEENLKKMASMMPSSSAIPQDQQEKEQDFQDNMSIQTVALSTESDEQKRLDLDILGSDDSDEPAKGFIKINQKTLSKYQHGIDIEKEILEQKIKKQRSHQADVAELISTIQNNAMENHQSKRRMRKSESFKQMQNRTKMLAETKLKKKQQFEEHLQEVKERNEYKDADVALLEENFQTGNKLSSKIYNNLKINKNAKRTKEQVREIFKNTIKMLQRLNINPAEIMETKVFSSKPFEHKLSRQLFSLIKADQPEQVAILLKQNKYMVYDFDYLYMTPLHWAAKRGFYKLTNLLLNSNSDIDAEDMIGRTPLSFAVEAGHDDIVELLLVNKASPYKTKYVDYSALAKSYVVQKMLAVSRRLHWAIKLSPNPNKAEQWKKEIQIIYQIRLQQKAELIANGDKQKKKKIPL